MLDSDEIPSPPSSRTAVLIRFRALELWAVEEEFRKQEASLGTLGTP